VVGLETAGSGITCNAVCPGWVRTPLVEKQISDMAAQRGISQKEATEELLAEKQPSLDFASPAQLGGTVAFLCSAAADQITDTVLRRWRLARAVANARERFRRSVPWARRACM
jgi:3-hydroxybutyrate dehydrogenase